MQPYKKHLNDFMQNVKLLNNDANNDLNMIPSTSSQDRRNQRHSSSKRMSFNDRSENSIDADEMELELSLAFPNNMDSMKRYSDDIWRKTISSDCEPSIPIWEKQPEVNKNKTQTPAIVWPSTSSHGLFTPPKNHFYGDDIWSNMSGGNVFFPTSAPNASTPSINRFSNEVKHRKKIPGNKPSTSSVEIDDDFNHMKKRLSLSSLRTSLCRQKAVENLNNGNAAVHACSSTALDDDDDFLQVAVLLLFFR